MYLARFSYDVAPANRERALKSMRQELEAARKKGLEARILVPLQRLYAACKPLSGLPPLAHPEPSGGPPVPRMAS